MSSKKNVLLALLCSLGVAGATTAVADVQIDINDANGAVGSPVVVNWDYSAADADDANFFQFDITFDPADLALTDFSDCAVNAPATHVPQCTNPSAGVVRVIVSDQAPPFQELPLSIPDFGNITFTINQPGSLPVGITGAIAGNTSGAAIGVNTTGGTVTGAITGDAGFASTPAPGAIIDLGSAVVGSASDGSPQNITVAEIGDQQLDVTAIDFGGATAFSSTTAPFSIADGGADVDVDVNCTPDARGDISGTLELTNNSVNDPNPQYTLNCTGLAPNVNVPAGPVAISGLTVDTNPLTETFDVTNPDDGFTSDAENVTASAAGDAEITVAPAGPLTIATDGSETFTVSCDNSADGNFSSTITIEWADPVSGGTASDTIEATCDVSNAVASFDSEPTAPGPLAFGTVTNGTTSAPLGIDVFNDGVGPSPDSDLTISNVTVDDAQFDAILVNSGPFEVGDPADGTDDIEVTCTPDAGAGAITGTLTVEHDGDDSPTSFDLTCEGESDGAFSSDPAPGGTLNLGVVPPNNTTAEGFIDFTNNGSVDDVTVDCTVTDDGGAFTFDPDPISFTLAPGETESAGFQCTPPDPTSFSAALSCEVTGDQDIDTAEYTVLCQGQPLVIPTMNRWGLLLMALLVLGLGGLAGRRMMA